MRNTNATSFVILSLLMHGLVAVALVFTPSSTISADKAGENIQVDVGPAADKAGVTDAPQAKEQAKPKQPAVAHAKVAKAKTVKAAAAPVAKINPPSEEPKPETTAQDEDKATDTAPVVAAETEKTENTEPAQAEEKLVPVKETPPDGIEAAAIPDKEGDKDTEAKSEDVQKTGDPAPVGVSDDGANNGKELNKGGADKADAVAVTDLKQMPGNKIPQYPMQARLEKRQGSLELLYRVTKEGKVTDIQVAKSSGYPDLDKAAVSAIAQYRFVPGQEGWARHPVNFTLKGEVATLPSKLRAKGAQND